MSETLTRKESAAEQHAPSRSAAIAVIIPVYGHSVLMCDALDSVLAQPDEPKIVGVIVNDGCKYPDTHWTCLEYAAAHPDRLVYLQQKNQGSATARNTGIAWALREVEGLEAVYFLDADNVLIEGSLATALDEMRRTGADFVYPPYVATGVFQSHEQLSPFSASKLLVSNYIDTGSLVHRRVLDHGLRFDAGVRGFEDWDFWLSATENGFRGSYARDLGLLYRKRPESQLTEHDLSRREATVELLQKHKSLYTPARQVEIASGERPRYAVMFSASPSVTTTSFADAPGSQMPRAELERALWQAIINDRDLEVPSYYVWVHQEFWTALKDVRLLPWLLVDAERALRAAPIYCVCAQTTTEEGELSVTWGGGSPRQAAMVVLRSDVVQSILRDTTTGWIESAIMATDVPAYIRLRTVSIPKAHRTAVRRVASAVVDDLNALHDSSFRDSAAVRWLSRKPAHVPIELRYSLLTEPYEAAIPLPIAPGGRDICFTLPFAEFGGADRVSYNMAHALRKLGWRPHLIVTNRNNARLPAEFARDFETISFLDDPTAAAWGGNGHYLGTGLTAWGNGGSWTKLWELMWFARVFVNNHSAAANAIAGRMKKLGVATFSHLHLVDMEPTGILGGHPMLALAYERGYTGLLGCSQQICDWLIAEGAPGEKVLEIRNGPGFLVTPEQAQEIMTERASREEGPLRVLYLGRLDRQKGLAALMEVHRRSIAEGFDVSWRIVGSAMVESGPAMSKEFSAALEPAVFDARDVLDVLAWADVLVLLSDYEGLPLVLVEAMLCGVVPVSTNVGAIEELITDGRDGFLVPVEDRERDTLQHLKRLSEDRGLLRSMSLAAHDTGSARNDWATSVEPLINAVRASERGGELDGRTEREAGDTRLP